MPNLPKKMIYTTHISFKTIAPIPLVQPAPASAAARTRSHRPVDRRSLVPLWPYTDSRMWEGENADQCLSCRLFRFGPIYTLLRLQMALLGMVFLQSGYGSEDPSMSSKCQNGCISWQKWGFRKLENPSRSLCHRISAAENVQDRPRKGPI